MAPRMWSSSRWTSWRGGGGCALGLLHRARQVSSGMSQVLYEEVLMEDGQALNPSRLDYKMPRSYEVPLIEHIIVETNDPFGPFGAMAIGEPIREMPITPARVLRAIGRREGKDS